MRWIVGIFLIVVAVLAIEAYRDMPAGPTPAVTASGRQFGNLRDEAIRNIGWVAGNARGHPIWVEVRPYLDEGGEYYDFFVRLAVPGANQQGEAAHNLALYDEWVAVGEKAAYDEDEGLRRMTRTVAIIDELRAVMRTMH